MGCYSNDNAKQTEVQSNSATDIQSTPSRLDYCNRFQGRFRPRLRNLRLAVACESVNWNWPGDSSVGASSTVQLVIGKAVVDPVQVPAFQVGNVALTCTQVPAQLIQRLALRVHLGSDDLLVFLKRDGAFLLVMDGRPLPTRSYRGGVASDDSGHLNIRMARPAGIEPTTTCLEGRCSIQLSYGRGQLKTTRRRHSTQARLRRD